MKKSIIAVSGIVVIGLAVGGIMLFNKPGVQPVLASNLQESPTPEESAAKEDESIGEEGGYATDASRGLSEADTITDETESGSTGGAGGSTSVETPSPEVEESTEFDYTLIDPDLHATPSKDQYGQTTVEIDEVMMEAFRELFPDYGAGAEWMDSAYEEDLVMQVSYYFDGGVDKEAVYNYILKGRMTFPTQQATNPSGGSGDTSGGSSSGGSGSSGGSTQVETPSQQPSGGNSGGNSGGSSGGSSESNPGGVVVLQNLTQGG